MPWISAFYGIVIEMYFGDHWPPHFHARYGEHVAKVSIATGEVIARSLPQRALRFVREWIELHPDELTANWERVVANEQPTPIDPLP